MSHPTSYEDGLAVLRQAWSNASITNDATQGAMFALRNFRYDPQRFEEIVAALRLMPRAAQIPSLEVIQLVWRMPTQMLMNRDKFSNTADMSNYDRLFSEILVQATQIIGAQLSEGPN